MAASSTGATTSGARATTCGRAIPTASTCSRAGTWPSRISPGDRGIGYARYKTTATYVAVIVDVEVDRASGQVKVPRAWTAVDSGLIINPDGLTNQIEGGVVQSTSWTLYEQVRFDQNGILAKD